uniref:Secreted protein n=1 Tax=Anguilla anguilla TaxID=7936 RepID=A0A0E9X500_ANGAN
MYNLIELFFLLFLFSFSFLFTLCQNCFIFNHSAVKHGEEEYNLTLFFSPIVGVRTTSRSVYFVLELTVYNYSS